MAAYCSPDWHEGKEVAAVYLLKLMEDGKVLVPSPVTSLTRFAACEAHVGRAVLLLLRFGSGQIEFQFEGIKHA